MTEMVDVHDLPEEQASLVQEFVEFLRRRRQKNKQTLKEEKKKNKEWNKLAVTSFARDWENEKDAVYDRWRERYHVPER